MVSWNMCAVLRDDADRLPQRRERGVPDVDAPDRDRSPGDVVQAREQRRRRGLARTRRPDERRHRPCRGMEADAGQDVRGGRRWSPHAPRTPVRRARPRLPAGSGRPRRRSPPTAARPAGAGRPAPRSTIGLQVEDLEHPLEAHQGGHHVDPHVGQGRERSVELREQADQGEERPDRQHPADDEVAAEPVDDRRRERGDQRECGEEPPVGHGHAHADVPHPAGARREGGRLVLGPPEQLHEECPGDVEPLVHLRAHVRVQSHRPPASCACRRRPIQRAGRRNSGTSRRETTVTCQDSTNIALRTMTTRDEVAEHAAEGRREGLLSADDVAVEPRDQRTGLGAGEERDRLALHVVVHLGAQVVDQSLADPGGVVAAHEAEAGIEDRQAGDDQGR